MRNFKFTLPLKYQVLNYIIDFNIPGFEKSCKNIKTLSVLDVECEKLYIEFTNRINYSIGKEFLPIVRLCDGEYIFLVGKNIGSYRLGFLNRTLLNFKESIKKTLMFNYQASGGNLYQSGNYNYSERNNILKTYIDNLKWISEKGILAMHFSWGKIPFTEGLWPSVKKIFDKNSILLTHSNYYPFYFIYAFLSSNDSNLLFENKRLLIINSADGRKKDNILESLYYRGAFSVDWVSISKDRSMFDKIKVDNFINLVDVVLIGAGVGKLNILRQLELLNVPCIDIGYYIEILADSSKKYDRTMCCTDLDLENNYEQQ
jgi:hypothetical protein